MRLEGTRELRRLPDGGHLAMDESETIQVMIEP